MKPGIILVGGGGHAKVCIEILKRLGYDISFCIVNETSPSICSDIPLLKGDHHIAQLRKEGYDKIFIAIGNNVIRSNIAQDALQQGYSLINAISPQAIVSTSAKLGKGILIMPGAIINADATIGDLTIINTGATIDHDCLIGEGVHIAPQCAIAGNVQIGEKSFIGIGSKVIPNIIIGKNVTVGAGGVVVKNLANNLVAVGVPAKIMKYTENG